ncbi:ATP-binding cassette domain-containing protein [Solirubrobacter soli]|uniref:ATP-binding cassette domain-containing protein n=1 Tax=Solirubrobacter soli TaxID=363832 RepID=UPI000422AA87|nr:ATP-binding cassette domain-containing protein [Solirubrobacter soli]
MIAVAPGELLAVVGHDGAPVRAASRVAAAYRERLGHVPAGRPVFPSLTVAENLAVGAYRDRRDKAAVQERLARVRERFPRLAEREAQQAGTLSGGEQQLLVIARALMGAPDLLILEEPSAGLAPPAVQAVAAALEGLTVLIADEQLALARHAHRIVLVQDDEVVLDAPRAQALADERLGVGYITGSSSRA